MEHGVIPEPLFSFKINRLKHPKYFILVKKSDKTLLLPFLGNIEDSGCGILLIRMHKANHFGKGFECRKTMIPGFGPIFPVTLKIFKERDEKFRFNMFHTKRFDLDVVKRCRKGKKNPESIPIGLYGLVTEPLMEVRY